MIPWWGWAAIAFGGFWSVVLLATLIIIIIGFFKEDGS